MKTYDPGLVQFARTERQKELLEAFRIHGSMREAERALGLSYDSVAKVVRALEDKAARRGYSPQHDMTKVAPESHLVKGVSTYYDKDGEVRGQWVKTTLDRESLERAIELTVRTLAEEVKGLSPVVPAPVKILSDVLTIYPVGDPHFGMHAWGEEAGEDFDLQEAKNITAAAFDRLIGCAPASDTGIILILGDLLHSDNNSNRTERSGNALDVDNRWGKVFKTALMTLVHATLRALEKHEKMIVRLVPGNHDLQSSPAIGLAISCFFHNNDRVFVDTSANPFWYHRFGKNLIGSTHGDMTKFENLPGIMATDKPVDWGLTQHRAWYVGHVHHKSKIIGAQEYRGCTVESFRTLAASDAWHNASGYRSGRDMCAIVLHKNFGEIERHRCDIGLIED